MHLLTQSALLKALGWSLFNSLWQMSLLWAFYHLFVLVFHDTSARARHGLSAVLLLFGSCWTALTFITAYWFAPVTGSWLSGMPVETYGHGSLYSGRWFVDEGLSWCSFFYLLVLCGLLVHYGNHYLRSRRITREGLSKIPPEYRVFVNATAGNMGILPAVRVHLSSLVDVPVTLGFLKPVILLPFAMITHLSPQQIEAILVHELAHIRRKDYLINICVTVMELLFFFNPFTRMLIGQLKKEREHCCDDLVLQFRYDPHAYVSALLSLARQHRQGRLAVAATGGSNQLLLQRARRILQQKTDRPGARALFLLCLAVSVTVLFSGIVRLTHTDRGTTPSSASLTTMRPATTLAAMRLATGTMAMHAATASTALPGIETGAQPILNIVPPNARPRPSHATASRTATLHSPHRPATTRTILMAVDEAAFFKTSGPATSPAPAYADLIIIDDRDYSIGGVANNDATPSTSVPAQAGFPFVPQSSFSFQYTDTLPPEDKLAMMQLTTERALRAQIGRLQSELKQQMEALDRQRSALNKAAAKQAQAAALASQTDVRQQFEQLFRQQLQLQQQYLKRLNDLQRQLQRACRRLTTVYI